MARKKITAYRRKSVWKHKKAKKGYAKKKKSSWKVKDRGKKGRTPKAEQWSRKIKIPAIHKISGYQTDYPSLRRQRALIHEVIQRGGGKKGTLSTFRTLNYLKNLSASRKADKVFKKDANYVGRKYGYKIK